MSASSLKRVIGIGASAAVAGGLVLAGAGAAQAKPVGPMDVSYPKSVTAGQKFTLKCQILEEGDWDGHTAKLKEKGAAINAKRTVNGNNCTMKIVLNAKGKHKFKVIVNDTPENLVSDWFTINVK